MVGLRLDFCAEKPEVIRIVDKKFLVLRIVKIAIFGKEPSICRVERAAVCLDLLVGGCFGKLKIVLAIERIAHGNKATHTPGCFGFVEFGVWLILPLAIKFAIALDDVAHFYHACGTGAHGPRGLNLAKDTLWQAGQVLLHGNGRRARGVAVDSHFLFISIHAAVVVELPEDVLRMRGKILVDPYVFALTGLCVVQIHPRLSVWERLPVFLSQNDNVCDHIGACVFTEGVVG